MKTLRKRALAKSLGKQYKSFKSGAFALHDKYGWIDYITGLSDEKKIELIKQ
jgi:hypothetical protein